MEHDVESARKSRTLNRELVWVVKWEPGPRRGTCLLRLSLAAPWVSRGECGLDPLLHEGKVCWHAVCVSEISTEDAQRSWVGKKQGRKYELSEAHIQD